MSVEEVEDNIFDFKVKDRLIKECEDKGYKLSKDSLRNPMILDMIVYCSLGREEEALLNLKTTHDFIRRYEWVQWRLVPVGQTFSWSDSSLTGELLMFEFWRKCFIKIKVSVKKRESLPSESFHEVILREYGRLNEPNNFATPDSLEAEGVAAIDSLKSASEAFNIEYNTT